MAWVRDRSVGKSESGTFEPGSISAVVILPKFLGFHQELQNNNSNRKEHPAYHHDGPTRPDSQCHLWADPNESDERARHEAGRKVLVDANMSDVDIKRILASTSPPQKQPPVVETPPAPAAAGVAFDRPPPAIVARAEPQQAVAADETVAAMPAMDWEGYFEERRRRAEEMCCRAEQQQLVEDPMAQLDLWLAHFRG